MAGDQDIKGIFTLWNRADTQAFRYIPRHVLHAVNSDIYATVQKRFFDFLNKQSLAPDLGQRHIQNLISLGFDDLNLYSQKRMPRFNGLFDPVCLPEGQLAAAGSDAQDGFHQWPHPPQLVALHPPQEEPTEAEELTVSPPPPLQTNPQADMSRLTFGLPQAKHASGS
jgi:hypothetical protein